MKTIDKFFAVIIIVLGILFWYFMLYQEGYTFKDNFDNVMLLLFTFSALTILFFIEKLIKLRHYIVFYFSLVLMFFAAICEGILERVKNLKIK